MGFDRGKEVQIVYRLFLENCYLLHVPRLPCQQGSSGRGWVIDFIWLELPWQYLAMTRNNLSIILISLIHIAKHSTLRAGYNTTFDQNLGWEKLGHDRAICWTQETWLSSCFFINKIFLFVQVENWNIQWKLKYSVSLWLRISWNLKKFQLFWTIFSCNKIMLS